MDKIKAAEERYPNDGSGSVQSKQQLAFIAGWDAALSTQSPKWVKASERKPNIRQRVCVKHDGDLTAGWIHESGYFTTYYGHEKDLSKIEWLDESSSSTHPLQEKIDGLREAIQQNIDWMKKNRPSIAGLGAPIHLLKQALETYK